MRSCLTLQNLLQWRFLRGKKKKALQTKNNINKKKNTIKSPEKMLSVLAPQLRESD